MVADDARPAYPAQGGQGEGQAAPTQRPVQQPPRQVTFEDDNDDLDVPDFLK